MALTIGVFVFIFSIYMIDTHLTQPSSSWLVRSVTKSPDYGLCLVMLIQCGRSKGATVNTDTTRSYQVQKFTLNLHRQRQWKRHSMKDDVTFMCCILMLFDSVFITFSVMVLSV